MSENLFAAGRMVLTAPGVPLFTVGARSGGGGGGGGGQVPDSGLSNVTLLSCFNQSNAVNANDADNALYFMAQAIGFYLGSTFAKFSSAGTTASPYIYSNGPAGASEVGGIGSYPFESSDPYQTYLGYNGGVTSGDAAGASLNSNGTGIVAYINGLTTQEKAEILGILWFWGETDAATFAYSQKSVIEAAYLNLMAVARAAVGKTAAQLPIFLMGPSYAAGAPAAMLREVWAELAANSANNVFFIVSQTFDGMSRNDTWNSTTGVCSGGNTDGGHRSAADNVKFYKRGALVAARAILASNSLSASLIPASLGTGYGPAITGATLSGNEVTLTITHDAGTDLVVPLLASQGVGFSVMDGGSVGSPGTIIQATACSRIDATHLLVTLASTPTHSASACRLFYPWPGETWSVQPDTEIGPGCAVTDNYASVTKISGFDINANLGTGWATNMPMQVPISMSSGVATFGFPLS